MFYLLKNLKTTLSFPPTDIYKIANKQQVWGKLRDKIIGKCSNQYGIIVHIPNPEIDGESDVIPLARVDSNGGCSFEIQFSAISFKAEKNDILWATIKEISPDCLSCEAGPVDIRIPISKLDPQLQYDKALNCFGMTNKNYRLQTGNSILCKCFESRIMMDNFMQIIAEIPKTLLDILITINS